MGATAEAGGAVTRDDLLNRFGQARGQLQRLLEESSPELAEVEKRLHELQVGIELHSIWPVYVGGGGMPLTLAARCCSASKCHTKPMRRVCSGLGCRRLGYSPLLLFLLAHTHLWGLARIESFEGIVGPLDVTLLSKPNKVAEGKAH